MSLCKISKRGPNQLKLTPVINGERLRPVGVVGLIREEILILYIASVEESQWFEILGFILDLLAHLTCLPCKVN